MIDRIPHSLMRRTHSRTCGVASGGKLRPFFPLPNTLWCRRGRCAQPKAPGITHTTNSDSSPSSRRWPRLANADFRFTVFASIVVSTLMFPTPNDSASAVARVHDHSARRRLQAGVSRPSGSRRTQRHARSSPTWRALPIRAATRLPARTAPSWVRSKAGRSDSSGVDRTRVHHRP